MNQNKDSVEICNILSISLFLKYSLWKKWNQQMYIFKLYSFALSFHLKFHLACLNNEIINFEVLMQNTGKKKYPAFC